MIFGAYGLTLTAFFIVLGPTPPALAASRCPGLEQTAPRDDGGGDFSIQFSHQDPMRGMAVSPKGHVLVSSAYKAALFGPGGARISLEGDAPDPRAGLRQALNVPGAQSTLVFSDDARVLVRADQGNVISSCPNNLAPAVGLFALTDRTASAIRLPPLQFGEFRKFVALAADGSRLVHEVRLDRERGNPVTGWLELVDLGSRRFQRIPLPTTHRGILNSVASAAFVRDQVLLSLEYGVGVREEGAVLAFHMPAPCENLLPSVAEWTSGTIATPIEVPAGLNHPVRGGMTFAADRFLLLRGYRDTTLGLVDFASASPKAKRLSPGVGTILAHRVSPNAKLLGIAGFGSIALYSTERFHRAPLRLEPRFQEDPESTSLFESRIYDIAFSPDSSQIAGACEDGYVRIWDTTTGKLVYEKRHETDALTHIAYVPDGTRVVTINREGTVFRSWNLGDK